MRALVCVFAAALAVFMGPSVRAQSHEVHGPGASPDTLRWLVVPALGGASAGSGTPVTTGGADQASVGVGIEELHRASEALRQELAVRGFSVWRADRAAERFEVVGSAPAPKISQSDIDRWVERSRAAVRYLARADYKAARRELKAAQRLANRAAAELNREAARAQQVLDTCLFMVRAYVETKNSAEARRQARECRQLVPRVEPTAFRHTPEVRTLLDEVDEEMALEAPGILEVRSTAPDCLVRINGVEFGRTPLSNIELPAGRYRMQVECEEAHRGRIHRVSIKSGENSFVFDAALERVVRTRPVLHLQYASAEAWSQRMHQAEQVASILGSANMLVVSGLGASEVRVDLSAEGRKPASVWLAVHDGAVDAEKVRRGVDALFEGRSVDFTGPQPIARASWAAEASSRSKVAAVRAAALEAGAASGGAGGTENGGNRRSRRGASRPRNQRIAGWSLLGLGVASMGASIGLHVWRDTLGDRFINAPANLSRAQQWHDVRVGVWTTAAFAGAATSAAMPLLLPDYARTPWWGWTLGALGLGLTGYAIYEGVTMTGCPEPYIADEPAVRACVARGQEAGRLSLALAGAAPLLTVPLVYLIRPLRAEPSVSVTRQSVMVQVRKVF